ncbi:MAG TPA: SdrD B-like domain-containing protein, partial [Tepidisphaeraceae bacterium]|nr:SdrD B-like domain-containing protein [Tepidisphaeraceae bacterium]
MSVINVSRRRKRMSDAARKCARSIYENLEHRILFDSTITVVANSCGSFGGADVSSVVIYDDANDNGVLDYGENSTSLTPTQDDNTVASGTLDISDDGHTVHLAAQVPSNEFVWGGNPAYNFTADGTEDGQSYWIGIGPYSSVSGKVFEDFNGNGTEDVDDSPLSGWTVYVDADGSGTLTSGDPTTTTDSSGNYTFCGAYLTDTVRVSPPNSSWSVGSPGASCGNGYEVTSDYMTGLNFGVQGPMTITGTVYDDTNDNGVHDTGESGVTGSSSWVVFDDVNGNGVLDSGEPSTTVDSSGNYTLDVTGAVSCHQLNLETPTGWRFTSPSADFYAIPDSAHCGTNFPGYDFNVTQKGVISGSVFEDMNAQASPLLSNPGVSGVTMTLIDATTLSTVATTTTDSSDNYSFRDLSTGGHPYEVEAGLSSPPTGFAAEATTSSSISLASGDYQ